MASQPLSVAAGFLGTSVAAVLQYRGMIPAHHFEEMKNEDYAIPVLAPKSADVKDIASKIHGVVKCMKEGFLQEFIITVCRESNPDVAVEIFSWYVYNNGLVFKTGDEESHFDCFLFGLPSFSQMKEFMDILRAMLCHKKFEKYPADSFFSFHIVYSDDAPKNYSADMFISTEHDLPTIGESPVSFPLIKIPANMRMGFMTTLIKQVRVESVMKSLPSTIKTIVIDTSSRIESSRNSSYHSQRSKGHDFSQELHSEGYPVRTTNVSQSASSFTRYSQSSTNDDDILERSSSLSATRGSSSSATLHLTTDSTSSEIPRDIQNVKRRQQTRLSDPDALKRVKCK